jgi:RND superfamily putative drug exporter
MEGKRQDAEFDGRSTRRVTMKLSIQAVALASARHPWRTIAFWAALVVAGVVAIGALLGGALATEGNPTNDPESERAADALSRAFPSSVGAAVTDIVVVRSSRYTVDEPQFRALVRGLGSQVRRADGIESVRTYLDGRGASLIARDRHAAMVQIAAASDDGIDDVVGAVERADATPSFAVTVTGQKTLDRDFNELSQNDLEEGELRVGLPAALIILLLVFGTVVAGIVPLLITLPSIVVALGLVAILAHAFSLSIFVVNMLTGMGLALAIDYSLFVVSRFREERGRGREKLDAVAASARTANRAVVFSGTTFVIAMFGMLIVPNSIMRSLAVGAILVGIVSVLASATLLPALLGLFGDGVDRVRIPVIGRRSLESANPEGRFWGAIVRAVLRRPGLSFALSVALLLALASPVFGMHIGTSGVTALPDRFESKQGFAALQRNFPGATSDPVDIVVSEGATRPATRRALTQLRARLATDARFGTGEIDRAPGGRVMVLSVPVRGDPSGDRAVAAVRELRSTIVPAAFRSMDANVLVGGTTSENIDYFDSVIGPAPWVIALVLGLTLVFLTVVFRSLVVAGTAVMLNLLSVGAAYGLLVLVFQHGVGADLLGFDQVDTIEAWVPLFLFSVLFGLSMDYQVFLLSRIRERYDETRDTTDAVTFGVASTARIITGAALIIVAVFCGFASGELIMFQQMGFGVAAALLIDATIIRSVVLPSTMKLLGDWNWYLPSWLEWLPRLQIEGDSRHGATTRRAALEKS